MLGCAIYTFHNNYNSRLYLNNFILQYPVTLYLHAAIRIHQVSFTARPCLGAVKLQFAQMQEHPSAVCALTAKQQLDDEEKGLARVVASQLVASQDSVASSVQKKLIYIAEASLLQVGSQASQQIGCDRINFPF